jgi:hypothetical protein
MPHEEQVNDHDVRKLLLSVSPNRATALSAMLDELQPVWLLNRDADRNLFQAIAGQPNLIRIGLKGSKAIASSCLCCCNYLSIVR